MPCTLQCYNTSMCTVVPYPEQHGVARNIGRLFSLIKQTAVYAIANLTSGSAWECLRQFTVQWLVQWPGRFLLTHLFQTTTTHFGLAKHLIGCSGLPIWIPFGLVVDVAWLAMSWRWSLDAVALPCPGLGLGQCSCPVVVVLIVVKALTLLSVCSQLK